MYLAVFYFLLCFLTYLTFLTFQAQFIIAKLQGLFMFLDAKSFLIFGPHPKKSRLPIDNALIYQLDPHNGLIIKYFSSKLFFVDIPP